MFALRTCSSERLAADGLMWILAALRCSPGLGRDTLHPLATFCSFVAMRFLHQTWNSGSNVREADGEPILRVLPHEMSPPPLPLPSPAGEKTGELYLRTGMSRISQYVLPRHPSEWRLPLLALVVFILSLLLLLLLHQPEDSDAVVNGAFLFQICWWATQQQQLLKNHVYPKCRRRDRCFFHSISPRTFHNRTFSKTVSSRCFLWCF